MTGTNDDTREPERPKPLLRVVLSADGTIELWSDRERHPDDLASLFRVLADAFEARAVTRVR